MSIVTGAMAAWTGFHYWYQPRRWLAQDDAFGRRSESTRPRVGHRPLRIGRHPQASNLSD